MNDEKKIKKHDYIVENSIEETMIGPLWARATIIKRYPGILKDPKSIEILEKMNYDFEKLSKFLGDWRGIGLLVRAHALDNAVKNYIHQHQEATVVNIAAGLDTTFFRVDNGKINWYDIDLPNATEFRLRFIPETPRSHVVSSSAFDLNWIEQVKHDPSKGIFFIAGGFIYYFSEETLIPLFKSLAEHFPGGGFAFDCVNKLAVKVVNKRAKKAQSDLSFKLAIGNPEKIFPRWSDKIKVSEWYTMYSRVSRNSEWPKKALKMIKVSEILKIAKIVILNFQN